MDSAPLREERVRCFLPFSSITLLHGIMSTLTCFFCVSNISRRLYFGVDNCLANSPAKLRWWGMSVVRRDRSARRRNSREQHVRTTAPWLLWRRRLRRKRATVRTSGCGWNVRRGSTRTLWPKPTRGFCILKRSWTRLERMKGREALEECSGHWFAPDGEGS